MDRLDRVPSAPTSPSPRGSLQILGLVWPALAVLMSSPITAGALGGLPDPDSVLLVSPTFLAAVAAPGYLRAVVGWVSIPALSRANRLWVRASFVVALLAAGIGAVIGLAFILPSAAAVLTATTLVAIWRRLEARTTTSGTA